MVMRYAPAKMPTRPPIRMAEASSAARLDIRISGYATQHSQAQHRSGPTPVGTKAGLEQGWPRTRLAKAKACKGQVSEKTWVSIGRKSGKDWASFRLAPRRFKRANRPEKWRPGLEAIQHPISPREYDIDPDHGANKASGGEARFVAGSGKRSL